MERFNKTAGQLAELFKSMTPGARVAAAVVVVVALISASYLVNHQIAGADAYLMGGESFSPSQLRDMQAAFGQAGLEANVDGTRVRVPRGQESKYMAALAEGHALPVDFGGYLNKALSSGGMMPMFRGQQDAALKAARQQELQLIIEHMRGVAKAAVQIDQARSNEFPRDKNIVTAAVMVELQGNQPLSDRTARAIRQVVASSVAGLKNESVAVIDWSNHRTMPGGGADSTGGLDEYTDYKERQELDWQQKITHVLEYIPGVLVSTNVELDAEGQRDQTQMPNGAAAPPAESSAPKRLAPPARAVKRVHVSVVVPHTYYEEIWRKEHPTPPGRRPYMPEASELAEVAAREKKKIETLVANLLPVQGDRAGAAGQVAVSTFHAPQAPTQPSWNEMASVWFEQHWIALTVAGLVMIGVMTMQSTVKSLSAPAAPAEQDAVPATTPFTSVHDDEIDQGTDPRRSDRLARRPSVAIHDELADIVRDDPDAAASILRTWIGNAS